MKPSTPYTSIGGQAVLEGVMMRSPHFIAVAVRKGDQNIVIRSQPYLGFAHRYPIVKRPILRGIVTLLESMIQGIDALSYSASVASGSQQATDAKLSRWAIASSIAFAFLMGMGLFVALPHALTVILCSESTFNISPQSPVFHLLDGVFKMGILLTYVYVIALMKDIHRVFQYHGAEHKSIYTFEAGEDLTVQNARKYSTLHPRCGTSFLLFLVALSVGVFSIVFPIFGLTQLTHSPFLNHLLMVLIKIVLMLPVAGLAYEFIKACAYKMENPFFKILMWPGMILQKLTTREPTDDQLEIALASLRRVIILEKSQDKSQDTLKLPNEEIEVTSLSELGWVQAQVTEFLEG